MPLRTAGLSVQIEVRHCSASLARVMESASRRSRFAAYGGGLVSAPLRLLHLVGRVVEKLQELLYLPWVKLLRRRERKRPLLRAPDPGGMCGVAGSTWLSGSGSPSSRVRPEDLQEYMAHQKRAAVVRRGRAICIVDEDRFDAAEGTWVSASGQDGAQEDD
jgi:hypothetical protein